MYDGRPALARKATQRTRRSAKDALQVPASFYGLSSTYPLRLGCSSRRGSSGSGRESAPRRALLPGFRKTPTENSSSSRSQSSPESLFSSGCENAAGRDRLLKGRKTTPALGARSLCAYVPLRCFPSANVPANSLSLPADFFLPDQRFSTAALSIASPFVYRSMNFS